MASERCWRDIALLRDIYSRLPSFWMDTVRGSSHSLTQNMSIHSLGLRSTCQRKKVKKSMASEKRWRNLATLRDTRSTFSSFLDTQSPRLTQFFDQKKETKVYLSLGQGGKVKKWMASEKRQRNIAALRDTSSLLAPFWILEVRGWPNSLTEKKTKQKYLSLGQGGKVKK